MNLNDKDASTECSLCYETYSQSKRSITLRGCGHVFCEQCLKNVAKLWHPECPTCRKPFKLEQECGGVKDFDNLEEIKHFGFSSNREKNEGGHASLWVLPSGLNRSGQKTKGNEKQDEITIQIISIDYDTVVLRAHLDESVGKIKNRAIEMLKSKSPQFTEQRERTLKWVAQGGIELNDIKKNMTEYNIVFDTAIYLLPREHRVEQDQFLDIITPDTDQNIICK